MKEYDPSVWQVSFYKDSSFCKMRTYKTTPSENIADIENLAKSILKYHDRQQTKYINYTKLRPSPNLF